ncbi:MAG: L,D-transpeptidase family protein [Pyrinomonadaceae bacterium]
MNKNFIVATVWAGISFIVLNQLFVMRQENIDLTGLENPRLVVRKKERLLQLFDGERFIKAYEMVLGFAPEGDKETEGDGKTPTGEFYVFTKNPNSKFHLSLGLSYPNIDAATRGLKENLISREEYDAIVKAVNNKQMPPQKTRLGGEIYIHGGGTAADWTRGCVALGNDEMTELFDAIPIGALVRIEP